MLELLRQRRWLGFSAFVLLMLALCVVLARWQWHRYELRQTENARLDAALAAPAVPVEEVLTSAPAGDPAPPLTPELEWRLVTATGTFDLANEVAIRRRPLDGRNGYWIVTPLVTDAGVLLVNRGWVATPEGDATTNPDVPAAPGGTVTVTGRLRPAEETRTDDAPPPGQAWAVDPSVLVAPGTAAFPAYVEVATAEPPVSEELTAPLPVPGHRGLNNLVYSGQWLLFALVGAIGWWRLMRQEAGRKPDVVDAPA